MRVDDLYKEYAKKIINSGYDEENKNLDVRAKWDNGKKAYAIYLPQLIFEYDENEVPITSLRKIARKTAIKELLRIYKDKSNDVNYLEENYGVKYWNKWKKEDGTLGKAYGYQVGKNFISPENKKNTNQIERLIHNLKNDPLNRRHIIDLYDVDDAHEMSLIPCAFLTMWTVTEDKLNMTLIQRSGDFLAAASPGGINEFQYYVLLRMICAVCNLKPGKFVHFVQNAHIYKKHIPIIKEIIEKDVKNTSNPKLILNPKIKNFNDFTIKDFSLENYNPNIEKYNIEIAE